MTGPPKERGSVRNVTIEGDPDRRTYYCEVRPITGQGLRPGTYCWVEFGAVWAEQGGRKYRVRGQWRQCIILPGQAGTSADVHVRFSPSPKAETPPPIRCDCAEGWMCEEHPDLPLNHDDCTAAGRKCDNPDCPWWKGPSPAAMDLQAAPKKPH